MRRPRRRGGNGLDAYRRHGGVHEDQYRTAKQSRRDAVREAEEAMAEERQEHLEYVLHAMGIGPDFEEAPGAFGGPAVFGDDDEPHGGWPYGPGSEV